MRKPITVSINYKDIEFEESFNSDREAIEFINHWSIDKDEWVKNVEERIESDRIDESNMT